MSPYKRPLYIANGMSVPVSCRITKNRTYLPFLLKKDRDQTCSYYHTEEQVRLNLNTFILFFER